MIYDARRMIDQVMKPSDSRQLIPLAMMTPPVSSLLTFKRILRRLSPRLRINTIITAMIYAVMCSLSFRKLYQRRPKESR
jgi:small neutral amino acid transporter SnatA (MarC family)